MNITQLRKIIALKLNFASAKRKEVSKENIEYWEGYTQALREVIAEDINHGMNVK